MDSFGVMRSFDLRKTLEICCGATQKENNSKELHYM